MQSLSLKGRLEPDNKAHLFFQSFFELDKLAHERKNYVSPVPYPYMFSQNYPSIDKIVSCLGKRMQLTGEEIESDFRIFEQAGVNEVGAHIAPLYQRSSRKRANQGPSQTAPLG